MELFISSSVHVKKPVFISYLIIYSIQSTTNTFQGIVISDGSSSYAVFIYNCTNMEWGGGVIGWQQSTLQYASHYASGQSSANSAVCGFQTSLLGSLLYKIGEYPICSVSLLC